MEIKPSISLSQLTTVPSSSLIFTDPETGKSYQFVVTEIKK